MSVELEILEPPTDPVYFCLGETSAVSQTIHRARQAANWPGCRNCPSRSESSSYDSISKSLPQIRRTPWGIRAAWQNGLTRLKAAQLIGLVTGHLLNEREVLTPETDEFSAAGVSPDPVSKSLTVVMGYDGRASSPDIYAGAVSAAIQNGCHVIDTGHSTASSIQETCRSVAVADFGIIVTGAGEAQSVTGFDLFDTCGQAVSVPWQSWGVRLRRRSESDEIKSVSQDSSGRNAMARLKQSIRRNELSEYPSKQRESEATTTTLELPERTPGAASRYRVSRRSGTCRSVDAEGSFRRWLQRWFPDSLETRMACLCMDSLASDRLEWLFQEAGVAGDIMLGHGAASGSEQLGQRVREIHAQWGICISEDDRYVTVANQQGHCLSAEQLSGWINDTIRASRPHVTTHVPAGEERIVIMDAGRPHQSASHDIISDGIALMGCICQIIQSGVSLPRTTSLS